MRSRIDMGEKTAFFECAAPESAIMYRYVYVDSRRISKEADYSGIRENLSRRNCRLDVLSREQSCVQPVKSPFCVQKTGYFRKSETQNSKVLFRRDGRIPLSGVGSMGIKYSCAGAMAHVRKI